MDFAASLANDSVADFFPESCGLNVTLSSNSCPLGIVNGNDFPRFCLRLVNELFIFDQTWTHPK
jgi:hypothetical protein